MNVRTSTEQTGANDSFTIDDLLRVFEQRGTKHIIGKMYLPQEMTNVKQYFHWLGGITLVDALDEDVKYDMLINGKLPQKLIQAGISPAAVYGGYIQFPDQGIFLDNYVLAFDNPAELRRCIPNFRASIADGNPGIFPHTLTATLTDGSKIEARAIKPIGNGGLTTDDNYKLKYLANVHS